MMNDGKSPLTPLFQRGEQLSGNLKCVPIINDSAHLHLTLADWESLNFSDVAIDALSLLVKSTILIPENAQTVFFDTRVRLCHKVSRSNILSSPFDGQKIPITPEKLKVLFQMLSEKYPNKEFIWVDQDAKGNAVAVNAHADNGSIISEHYWITEQPGQDAEKGILYESLKDNPCDCYYCQHFTVEYLEHLAHVGVPLGMRLRILHNLSVMRGRE